MMKCNFIFYRLATTIKQKNQKVFQLLIFALFFLDTHYEAKRLIQSQKGEEGNPVDSRLVIDQKDPEVRRSKFKRSSVKELNVKSDRKQAKKQPFLRTLLRFVISQRTIKKHQNFNLFVVRISLQFFSSCACLNCHIHVDENK